MSAEADLHLADAFPPATEEHWLALVDKVLKGKPLSTLESATPGGVVIEPLYTASAPGAQRDPGVPGEVPFVRGASATPVTDTGWAIRCTVSAPDADTANREALRDLERGASELTVQIATDGHPGIPLDGVEDLARVLDGVLLDLAPVHLRSAAAFDTTAQWLETLWDRAGLAAEEVSGGLGADPLGTLATTGTLARGLDAALAAMAELATAMVSRRPGVRAVSVDTTAYVEAGATEVQELALMVATGAAYLRVLGDAGLDADAAASQIEITLSADADVFVTIAKLRAARRVWSSLLSACGATGPGAAPRIHVRTAQRMMTRRDPWVNLLRVTAAGFAAGVGGATSVTTGAFDSPLGRSGELGRRMARNTQLLLLEESHLGHVLDPAGGSWYVETLTDQIAEAAWAEAGRLDKAGGVAAGLLDGSIATAVGEAAQRHLNQVAVRSAPITGVTEFADLHEKPLERDSAEGATAAPSVQTGGAAGATGDAAGATGCQPLVPVRWAQDFEALRDASDAHLEATGARPKVFLVNIGPVAAHTARSTFASNLFAAGGIEAVSGERGSSGYETPADAVQDASESGAGLFCLCSSDTLYAESAVAFATALRDAGLGRLYLAGAPGDLENALREAGVDEFVHVGVDALDVLRRAHAHLGTPTEMSR